MRGHPDRAVPRLHAGPDHVRRPLLHGPARLAHRPHRRRDHRLALRGRVHADHDPDGTKALDVLGPTADFVPCLHSVGAPLDAAARPTSPGPATPRTSTSSTSPRPARSGPTARATAATPCSGKKCFALRIASVMARDDGWLAEHMLILKLTSPDGEVRYVAGAFPSACGKTNLAMLVPTIPGWKVETIGDDICWMKFGPDGRLVRHQPRGRLLRCGPRDRATKTNPNAMKTLHANCIFTNTALTDDGDVWWEGMTDRPPGHLTDWQRRDWTPEAGTPASHPNARFTVPAEQNPACAPDGRTRPACRSRPSCSVGGAGRSCRSSPSPSTGPTACSSGRSWRRRPRRRPPGPSATSAGPLRHAAVLRLQHGRLLRPLAPHRRRPPTPPSSPGSTT